VELFAEQALLPEGWARDVRVRVGAEGRIESVQAERAADGAVRVPGPLLPALANLHSHAFQRAMAGLAETVGDPNDSFWSWREQMYQLVLQLDPDQVEAIAAHLYVEMLKGGFTTVGEFHYLHHDPRGRAYDDPAEMAGRVLAGAQRAGIAVTLLPVLYSHGGFGGREAGAGQRRFLHDTDAYLALYEGLRRGLANHPLHRTGLCFHSLRAVTPAQIGQVLASAAAGPVHIHVAEQTHRVERTEAGRVAPRPRAGGPTLVPDTRNPHDRIGVQPPRGERCGRRPVSDHGGESR
jgi:formimidoylglutamate deiminase